MMEPNGNGERKENGKSKIFAIIIIVLVLIIVIGGVVVAKLLTSQNKKDEKRTVLVTEENAEDIAEEVLSNTKEENTKDPGYYTVTMEPVWHFSSGDAESGDAVVINADSNVTPVFFDIFLEEDESHVIYKSPVIPLGGELRNIKLDEKLVAGNYECVAEYHLLDEEQNTVSTVRVGLTIVVEQ